MSSKSCEFRRPCCSHKRESDSDSDSNKEFGFDDDQDNSKFFLSNIFLNF